MDETRDEAVLRMFVQTMEHLALIETALTVMLSDAPADIKSDMAKRLAASAAEAMETAANLYAILDGEG